MDFDNKFIEAIAFCLAYEYNKGDKNGVDTAKDSYRDLAMWALSLAEESIEPEDSSLKVALVSGGATKIKSYVFESARLPEIRGASGLLDRINLDVPKLWEKLGCKDCIIYANGGEVLAFAPIREAARLADEIERLYSSETLVAQSVAVYQVFTLKQLREGLLADEQVDQNAIIQLLEYNPAANKTFGSLVTALALDKYRRRDANPDSGRDPELRAIPHFETMPFARRCSSCERRTAVVNAKVSAEADEDLPLCEPCARKRVFGLLAKREPIRLSWWDNEQFHWQPDTSGPISSWFMRFERWLKDRPELKKKYAVNSKGVQLADLQKIGAVRDLSEIAQASQPTGFVGVIYADGNNMGQLLEYLKTPSDYATFACYVDQATRHAVFEALARNLQTREIQSERGKGILVHPFEILSIGGDDLFLIVPAHVALPVACAIARKVESELRDQPLFYPGKDEQGASGYQWERVQRCAGSSPARQCTVSMSVGVVLADAHTPVFYLAELAEQLLKSAKRRAKWLKRERNYYGGTVDFLSLKSTTMISGMIERFRAMALTRDHGRLYARPYTIEEMEALLKSIQLLKRSGFPRNQLYRLRESLHTSKEQSMVDYLYFLSREQKTRAARGEIEALWSPSKSPLPHPWQPQLEAPELRETIWHDLVDIYDFVPKPEEDHAGDQD